MIISSFIDLRVDCKFLQNFLMNLLIFHLNENKQQLHLETALNPKPKSEL